MKLPSPLELASFRERLTRFSALVERDGLPEIVHLPNSGRLGELLVPGYRVWLAPAAAPGRKTRYDLELVEVAGVLVSADARLPGAVVHEALCRGELPSFRHLSLVQRESFFGESRLDFMVSDGQQRCYIEVKSVTLLGEGGRGLFPDAPTSRGSRHLRSLMEARRQGYGGAVIFLIQREDATGFSPHHGADPEFGRTLRQAAAVGVEVQAYGCRVTLEEIGLLAKVPVILD